MKKNLTFKQIPEKNKILGIYYAFTSDGIELPIIDITQRSFALNITSLDELYKTYILQQQQTPNEKEIQKQLQCSIIGRSFLKRAGSYLDAISTYLLKLGSNNLGSYAQPFDHQIVETLPCISLRLRLRHMAYLTANKLAPLLKAQPKSSLHLLNIAGGVAIDSLNALILLPKKYLENRRVTIHVLDLESEGPQFGQRALDALLSKKAPLECLDIELKHIPYNWSQVDMLNDFIKQFSSGESIIALTSEGGLFEYGSDAEIFSNLKTLRPFISFIVGSISRADMQNSTNKIFAIHPRKLEEFKAFVSQSGWFIDQVFEEPFSYVVSFS